MGHGGPVGLDTGADTGGVGCILAFCGGFWSWAAGGWGCGRGLGSVRSAVIWGFCNRKPHSATRSSYSHVTQAAVQTKRPISIPPAQNLQGRVAFMHQLHSSLLAMQKPTLLKALLQGLLSFCASSA